MADEEVRASQTGPNGERLELKIGNRSLGITSRDLLMFAFVAGIFVFIYINSQSNRENLLRLSTGQERLMELLAQYKGEIVTSLNTQTTTLLTATAEEKVFLLEQVAQSRQRLDDQTETLRKYILRHDLNLRRAPAEQMPLELEPPEQEKAR